MSNVNVSIPGKTYSFTLDVLRGILEKHTEAVQGIDTTYERCCSVCGREVRRYQGEHRPGDHLPAIGGDVGCWMGDVVRVLGDLLS